MQLPVGEEAYESHVVRFKERFFTAHCWFTDKEGSFMAGTGSSLYTRLGGYDAIAAVVDDLQVRLEADPLLGRYWSARRSLETDRRVRQLTIDYISAAARGPTFYSIVFGTHYARFQVPSPVREKVRMRGGKRVFLSASPHPSPLPEGEGIFRSVLPMAKICAEQY